MTTKADPNPTEGLSPFNRVRDVAKHLHLTERTIFRMIARGELAAVKIGKRTLIARAEVARLIAECSA